MDVLAFLTKFIGTTARIGAVSALAAFALFLLVRAQIQPFASLAGTILYQALMIAGVIGISTALVDGFITLRQYMKGRVVFRQQLGGTWNYVDDHQVLQINAILHVTNRQETAAVLSGRKICVPKVGRKHEWQDCFQVEANGDIFVTPVMIGPTLTPHTVSVISIRHIHRQAARPQTPILLCLFEVHDQWRRYLVRLRLRPAPKFTPQPPPEPLQPPAPPTQPPAAVLGASIEIFRIPISKARLRAIPAEERHLLLLTSHAVNQLAVLRKLLIFSLNYDSDNEIENLLSAGQSQVILRILFGALAEAWELVRRPINQKIIGKDYIGVLEPDGVAVYDNLKKHFGESNFLHTIRNTIAYHYPTSSELEAAFNDVPEDEDWAWYPSHTINNSFYLASDMIISAGVKQATGEADYAKAFKKIGDVVMPVSDDMIEFLLFLMRAIIGKHLGLHVLAFRNGTIIKNVPNLYQVAIPFFTVRDEDKA